MRFPWRRRDPDYLACRQAVEFIAGFLDDALPPRGGGTPVAPSGPLRRLRRVPRAGAPHPRSHPRSRRTRHGRRLRDGSSADGSSADGTDGVEEATRRAIRRLYRDRRGG